MQRPIVAIIGSPRIEVVGDEKLSDAAREAGERLGTALSEAGFKLFVYSSNCGFIEPYVVKGFLATTPAAGPDSIIIHHPIRSRISSPRRQMPI
jgi:hypothetical protein